MLAAEDGKVRCSWAGSSPAYLAYHDHEWGFPVTADNRLFEKLSLEGFQAGLSWSTILAKREAFRAAFAGFDIASVAAFTADDVHRLLNDAGIVRHRGKIEATLNNAQRALEVIDEHGSLAAYVWGYEPDTRASAGRALESIPSTSPESVALSKDLKRRGWRFVGPTTVYAFLQAMGLVNDHVDVCFVRPLVDEARRQLVRPGSS